MLDPEAHADEAGLRYITDAIPGVRRRRAGRGFVYIGPSGRRITNVDRLAWFKRLAIPPAWTDVWISPLKGGHLQATGRDARGRKQYRYHPHAAQLGNTPAVCRACYVHPEVVAAYLDGTLVAALDARAERALGRSAHGLAPEEAAVVGLLRARLARERRARTGTL